MTPEYLAGFFDGEGCIDTQIMYPSDSNARKRFYCRPRVRISQSDAGAYLLEALCDRFGGHLCSRKGKGNQNNSVSWEILSIKEMRAFLGLIIPHLVIKKEQAKLALWWLDNLSGRQSNKGYPGIEKARKQFSQELKDMKLDPQRLSEAAAQEIQALIR